MASMAHSKPKPQSRRAIHFLLVGGFCALLQLLVLRQLLSVGVTPYVADGIGFLVSAQFNFVLNYRWTWGDSLRFHGNALFRRWLAFNGLAVMAAGINASVYNLVRQVAAGFISNNTLVDMVAVGLAIPASSVFMFLALDRFVFKKRSKSSPSRKPKHYDDRSIAWFLPAHNEAKNLPLMADEVVSYFTSLGCDFSLIIVNDGSSDGTAEVSEALADQYSEVSVVHHESNYGYGAALKTGLRAGLETGHSLIGFCDADLQFRIRSLEPMLVEIERSDLVLGYRIKRADNAKRRLFSFLWHNFSSMILGYEAIDTDCGFKLFRRDVVEALLPNLQGEYATISAEMIARAQRLGYVTAEVGVEHYPRFEGEQSGADFKVIYGSFKNLYHTRKAIRR